MAPTQDRPYVFLKFDTTTSNYDLEYLVKLEPGKVEVTNPPTTHVDDFNTRTRTITIYLTNLTGANVTLDGVYHNVPGSFDPSQIDYISLVVKEGTAEKGKGTVDSNEADASGGDGAEVVDRILELYGG